MGKEEGTNGRISRVRYTAILHAMILPPHGVFIQFGCGVKFWNCLGLTLFGYLPGIIYALYVIIANK